MKTLVATSSVERPAQLVVNYLLGLLLLGFALAAPSLFAVEVPFSVKHTVDSDFGQSQSVFAADIDGDGDTDLLGAARLDNDITWWENTAGDGSAWTEHLISGNFMEATSVFATDIDGDGDIDVLGAAYVSDAITW